MYTTPLHNTHLSHIAGVRHDKAGDGGSGDNGGSALDKGKFLPDDVFDKFQNLIERMGSAQDAAEKLFAENKDLRDEVRSLESKMEDMQQVGEDQVVVDADEYQKLQGLADDLGDGDPEDAQERVRELVDEEGRLHKMRDRQKKQKMAEHYGYNSEAFSDLTEGQQIEWDTRKTDDGETEHVAVVREAGEDGQDMEVSQYIDQQMPHFKPALEATDQAEGQDFPPQSPHSDSEEGSDDLVSQMEKKVNERQHEGNPLLDSQNGEQES